MTDLEIRIFIQDIIADKQPKDENELEKLSDDLDTIIQDEIYNYACEHEF